MRSKHLLLSALMSLLIFASCTVQKRQHLPGYHIDWRGEQSKKLAKSHEINENENLASNEDAPKNVEIENVSSPALPQSYEPVASTDEGFSLASDHSFGSEMNETIAIEPVSTIPTIVDSETSSGKNSPQIVKELKSEYKKFKKKQKRSESSVLRIIGWVLIVVGIVTLFGSIIAGALVMLLGLIFVLAG